MMGRAARSRTNVYIPLGIGLKGRRDARAAKKETIIIPSLLFSAIVLQYHCLLKYTERVSITTGMSVLKV
jgi:hypothetical protein